MIMLKIGIQYQKVPLLLFGIILSSAIRVNAQQQPMKATPAEMVDALHGVFGKHANARAVHAKGIITEGTFTPAPGASALSAAPHLQHTKTKVTVRFSDFTGIPDISDVVGGGNPRGLAIKFYLPDGKTTDIVSHSFNGFPVATTDEFRSLLQAIAASGPDAAKPTALEQFLGTHPIAKTFLTTQNPPSVSYATLSYFGVNAFQFTNKKGETHYIRYQFIPEHGDEFLSAEALAKKGPDYLSEEIRERLSKHAVKFKLYAQVAEVGDVIENPAIAWPSTRNKILLGTIEIKKVTENTPDEDKKLFFIPDHLPNGIAVADQMLKDRSRTYPVSVKARQ